MPQSTIESRTFGSQEDTIPLCRMFILIHCDMKLRYSVANLINNLRS